MSEPILKIFRNEQGYISNAIFSDAEVPLDQVASRIDEPRLCQVEAIGSTPDDRRYEKGLYYLQASGSVYEDTSSFTVGSTLGPRVLLHAGVKINDAVLLSGSEIGANTKMEAGSTVQSGARLGSDGILGPNCSVDRLSRISDGFKISMSEIGPNCDIGANADISRTKILGSLTVGSNLELANADLSTGIKIGDHFKADVNLRMMNEVNCGNNLIVGSGVRIAPHAYIGGFSWIGNGVTIHDYAGTEWYCKVGDKSQLDVRATLAEGSVLGNGVYIGPGIEYCGEASAGSRVTLSGTANPVWPIPKRTFEAMLAD